MANVKISQLPSLASLSGDDVLPVVNGNITYKVTANAIADFVGGGGGANTGNVTFDNVAVQGQGAQLFLSPDPDFTANSAYVRVRAGDVASHIHMDTGDNAIYDLFLGDDSKHVQVSSTGNIIMQSFDSGNTTAYALTLDTTGNLTFPGVLKVPGDTTSVPGTNENGNPGGPGAQTFTAAISTNPNIDLVQPGWTVTGNNLVGTTTVTIVDEISPGLYEITTDTTETDPFWYNDVYNFSTTANAYWTFDGNTSLTAPGNISTTANVDAGAYLLNANTVNVGTLQAVPGIKGAANKLKLSSADGATDGKSGIDIDIIAGNANGTALGGAIIIRGGAGASAAGAVLINAATGDGQVQIGETLAKANIAVTGNVTTAAIFTDNYFYANGDPFGGSYGDSNVSTYLSGGTNTDGFSSTGNITLGGSGSPITLQTYSSTTTQVTLGWSPSISPAPFATGDTILVEGGSGVDGSWAVVSCTTDDVTFTCNLNPGSGAYTDLPAPTVTLLYISSVTASGNISGGNLISTGGISASGTIVASGDITSGGDVIGVTVQTANLTVNGNSSLNGNVTVTGLNSNVIRRAFGLVAADTYVTLDDLKARVTSSTSQLSLILTTGSWQATGWTESFTGGGTPIINSWVNLPLSSGFDTASLAMNSQGNGCRCIISDQTPNAKVYQITVVRSGTTGALWNISIERLV